MILLHLDPKQPSLLASILGRICKLKVKEAKEGDEITPGRILVAGPNKHMIATQDEKIALTLEPPVHYLRPSADPLFASLATVYGARAIAVVLTGTGSDGASGAEFIKKHGGTVIVQKPQTAEFCGMPSAASNTGAADFELEIQELAPKLLQLCGEDKI